MTADDRLFTKEALSTFLAVVESVINSCFLTIASDDIDDLEPITQNHHLLGRPSLNYQPKDKMEGSAGCFLHVLA